MVAEMRPIAPTAASIASYPAAPVRVLVRCIPPQRQGARVEHARAGRPILRHRQHGRDAPVFAADASVLQQRAPESTVAQMMSITESLRSCRRIAALLVRCVAWGIACAPSARTSVLVAEVDKNARVKLKELKYFSKPFTEWQIRCKIHLSSREMCNGIHYFC
jgi:hypothetical protein